MSVPYALLTDIETEISETSVPVTAVPPVPPPRSNTAPPVPPPRPVSAPPVPPSRPVSAPPVPPSHPVLGPPVPQSDKVSEPPLPSCHPVSAPPVPPSRPVSGPPIPPFHPVATPPVPPVPRSRIVPVTTATVPLADLSKNNATAPTIPMTATSVQSVQCPVATDVPVPSGPTFLNNSNYVGFQDRNWYKIRNVGDNNVIQVDPKSKKLICMPEDNDKDDLQRFRAVIQPNGKYRIVPKFQKSATACQVWDFLLHRQLLVQMKESVTQRFTQNWTSEHVPGYNSLYLIQSGPAPTDQKCLKNMGSGEQIQIVGKSVDCERDHFAHWVLELQDVSN